MKQLILFLVIMWQNPSLLRGKKYYSQYNRSLEETLQGMLRVCPTMGEKPASIAISKRKAESSKAPRKKLKASNASSTASSLAEVSQQI